MLNIITGLLFNIDSQTNSGRFAFFVTSWFISSLASEVTSASACVSLWQTGFNSVQEKCLQQSSCGTCCQIDDILVLATKPNKLLLLKLKSCLDWILENYKCRYFINNVWQKQLLILFNLWINNLVLILFGPNISWIFYLLTNITDKDKIYHIVTRNK